MTPVGSESMDADVASIHHEDRSILKGENVTEPMEDWAPISLRTDFQLWIGCHRPSNLRPVVKRGRPHLRPSSRFLAAGGPGIAGSEKGDHKDSERLHPRELGRIVGRRRTP